MRALRRAHAERLKIQRKNYWGGDQNARITGKVLNHPKGPCWCCSNPRRGPGSPRTVKECAFLCEPIVTDE